MKVNILILFGILTLFTFKEKWLALVLFWLVISGQSVTHNEVWWRGDPF